MGSPKTAVSVKLGSGVDVGGTVGVITAVCVGAWVVAGFTVGETAVVGDGTGVLKDWLVTVDEMGSSSAGKQATRQHRSQRLTRNPFLPNMMLILARARTGYSTNWHLLPYH